MDYDDLVELYDWQYASYRDDLHFYAQLGQQVPKVLEIGAGTGRVSLYLARRGINVVGVEPSAGMLARATVKAEAEASSNGHKLAIELIQASAQDMRLGEQFELVIAPFNALMHLYTPNEQAQALQNIRAHTKQGGRLVFDLYMPNFGQLGVLRHEGETFFSRQPDSRGSRSDVFLLQRHDAANQLLTTEYFIDTTGTDQRLTRSYHTLRQRYYTRYEMEWLLRACGFASPKVSGSFQGGPLTENSEIMLFQAKAV